ncbi:hypothetical protein PCANC_21312 [Puccinia coronata f. sp. avenae]|uniref:Uncharacterized protein n=1 Tax=Puccinia coronata f. sp. avenae TaxID=200324 RepID=A0A2N5SCZ8_9BASI|nr:hypothetical protein PCANC_26784 [Puccinia coronata f. sp. avenae]PLW23475.1 hypothetical protein PCASD_13636 [Puccinia coronata f. sp. avenae]PLW37987.1 hypothetical protein PCANC_21312 [Puccinia coronata f. sp. avenae]
MKRFEIIFLVKSDSDTKNKQKLTTTPWGGFLKNPLVRWTLFGKSVQQTLRERPLDANLVKRPLDDGNQTVQWALLTQSARWTLHGSVQRALHLSCAHWTLFESVQWALLTQSAHWTLHGSVQWAQLRWSARWTLPWSVQRALCVRSAHWTLFWKRLTVASNTKRPLDASKKQ